MSDSRETLKEQAKKDGIEFFMAMGTERLCCANPGLSELPLSPDGFTPQPL